MGRALLENGIKNGAIPDDMLPRDVFARYAHRHEFSMLEKNDPATFARRLKSLRKSIKMLHSVLLITRSMLLQTQPHWLTTVQSIQNGPRTIVVNSSGTILKLNPFLEMTLRLGSTRKGSHRSFERCATSTRNLIITNLPRKSTKRHRRRSGMNQSRSGMMVPKVV